MADLKLAFETMDLSRVQTYIQSGNVLFESGEGRTAAQADRARAGSSVWLAVNRCFKDGRRIEKNCRELPIFGRGNIRSGGIVRRREPICWLVVNGAFPLTVRNWKTINKLTELGGQVDSRARPHLSAPRSPFAGTTSRGSRKESLPSTGFAPTVSI